MISGSVGQRQLALRQVASYNLPKLKSAAGESHSQCNFESIRNMSRDVNGFSDGSNTYIHIYLHTRMIH